MSLPSVMNLVKLYLKHPGYMRNLLTKKIQLNQRYHWIKHNAEKCGEVPPPLFYKFILTQKCNLRCDMCMLWGEQGVNRGVLDELEDLKWDILEKTIKQVARTNPGFIFSGGEPLMYSHFGELPQIIKKNRCFSTVCTNGYYLDDYCDILSDNRYISLLVSLDGLEKTNNKIRGKGVYEKVTGNIKLLKSMRKPPYIGVELTLRPENIHEMYEYCKQMVELDVDWIVFNPCWFITENEGKDYEDYMKQHFNITPTAHKGFQLPYPLDVQEFAYQMGKILSEKWPIQISSYFNNKKSINNYLNLSKSMESNCVKQYVRMDITNEAKVVPCILYPDLEVGDLKHEEALTIWNNSKYSEFRELSWVNPPPICKKCDVTYLYKPGRTHI